MQTLGFGIAMSGQTCVVLGAVVALLVVAIGFLFYGITGRESVMAFVGVIVLLIAAGCAIKFALPALVSDLMRESMVFH
jgi:hypothetical protein